MSTNFIPSVSDDVEMLNRTKPTDLPCEIFISVLESPVSLRQIKPWLLVSCLMTKRTKLYKCLLNFFLALFCFCFVISLKGTQIIHFYDYVYHFLLSHKL